MAEQMSKQEWELREKRDLATRVYNSFAINNPKMTHKEITERVEEVIEWLFNTYGEKEEDVRAL
jgi:hypothetical protein